MFYEQYLTIWGDTLQSLGVSLFAIFVVTFVLMGERAGLEKPRLCEYLILTTAIWSPHWRIGPTLSTVDLCYCFTEGCQELSYAIVYPASSNCFP